MMGPKRVRPQEPYEINPRLRRTVREVINLALESGWLALSWTAGSGRRYRITPEGREAAVRPNAAVWTA